MWSCIKNCVLEKLWWVAIVATILAVLAGIIAAFGGLTIVLGPITIGVVGSAIIAGLLVFGAVIAMLVLACVLGCAVPSSSPDDSDDVVTVPPIDDRDDWPPTTVGG
jgi:hypothetical protein